MCLSPVCRDMGICVWSSAAFLGARECLGKAGKELDGETCCAAGVGCSIEERGKRAWKDVQGKSLGKKRMPVILKEKL